MARKNLSSREEEGNGPYHQKRRLAFISLVLLKFSSCAQGFAPPPRGVARRHRRTTTEIPPLPRLFAVEQGQGRQQQEHSQSPFSNLPAAVSTKTRKKKPQSLNQEISRLRNQRNGGIALAEARLDQAIDSLRLLDSSSTPPPKKKWLPDEVSFNSILTAYSKSASRNFRAPQQAQSLLQKMEALAKEFPQLQDRLTPSTFTYNAVLETYLKSCTSRKNRRRQVHQSMLVELFRDIPEPNTYTYNLMLQLKDSSIPEWKQVEQWALDYLNLLDDDDSLLSSSNSNSIQPDFGTYNTILTTYAREGRAKSADDLLQKLLRKEQTDASSSSSASTKSPLRPDKISFNLVFKALANSLRHHPEEAEAVAQRADELLAQMESLYTDQGYIEVKPDHDTFNHILNVHAGCGNTERAEELLDEVEHLFQEFQDTDYMADRIAYTTAMKAYSTRMKSLTSPEDLLDCAHAASQIFEQLQSLAERGRPDSSPSILTYNTIISIWSNVGTRQGMETATAYLEALKEDKTVSPDTVTYTTLIQGWSRTIRLAGRYAVPEAGFRAQQLLEEMEQLPPHRQRNGYSRTMTYNSVLSAWAKTGDKTAPQKVDALYATLEDKYLAGMENAQPNQTTFLSIIDAYAKSRIPDAEARIDHLLERMAYLRNDFGISNLQVDRTIYNACLNALAKSCQPSAVETAENILTLMETSPDPDLLPDIVTYAAVIDCHTKCNKDEGGASTRADELLRFVEGSYRNRANVGHELLKPNAVFYSAILQAWAKSSTVKGATKAEELLRRNLALYEEGSHDYAKPHVILYNAGEESVIARQSEPAIAADSKYLPYHNLFSHLHPFMLIIL